MVNVASQFQDRGVCNQCGRVGWAYVGGVRRSADGSQVLLDAPYLCIRGAPRGRRRGRNPGRTRSNRLARQSERQVTSERITPHSRREPAKLSLLADLRLRPKTPNLKK